MIRSGVIGIPPEDDISSDSSLGPQHSMNGEESPRMPSFTLRIPELKPSEESRVAEDMEAWLNGIELRFRLSRVEQESDKIGYAGLFLSGRALNCYIARSFGAFADFEQELKATFYPPHYHEELSREFLNLR